MKNRLLIAFLSSTLLLAPVMASESEQESTISSYMEENNESQTELIEQNSTVESIENEEESIEPVTESFTESAYDPSEIRTGDLIINKQLLSNVWHVGCDVMGDQAWVKDEISNPQGLPSLEGHRKNKCGDPTHWNIYINHDGIPYMLQEIKSGATNGTLNTCFYTDDTYQTIRDISDIQIGERVYWTTWNFDRSLGTVGVWHHTGITYPEVPEFEFEFNNQIYILEPNQSLTLKDVPAGTYTITEKYHKDYIIGDVSIPYTQEEDGDIKVEVTILPDKVTEVDFINIRGDLPEPTPAPENPPVESEPESTINELESVVSSTVESVIESTPESTELVISTPESIIENMPESIVESIPESVPESTIESISDSTSQSTPESMISKPESIESKVESESTTPTIQPQKPTPTPFEPVVIEIITPTPIEIEPYKPTVIPAQKPKKPKKVKKEKIEVEITTTNPTPVVTYQEQTGNGKFITPPIKTGDNSPIILYVILLALAFIVIIMFLFTKKK